MQRVCKKLGSTSNAQLAQVIVQNPKTLVLFYHLLKKPVCRAVGIFHIKPESGTSGLHLLLKKITPLPDAVEMYVINTHSMHVKGKIQLEP